MKITKLEHSNSKELIQVNGRSEWKGFVLHAEVGENEDVLEAGQKLLAKMEKLHELYSTPRSVWNNHEEPLPPKSEEQISREQQIEGYKQIIDMATTKKMLELHRPGIARMEDSALTAAFNNKINQLQ